MEILMGLVRTKGCSWIGGLVAVTTFASWSMGHFVYLVPQKDSGKIQVVFSEELAPDEQVNIDKIASIRLKARVNEKDIEVPATKAQHSLDVSLPSGASSVYGKIIYGVTTRSQDSFLLVYHPKLLIGSPSPAVAKIGEKAEWEIVPQGAGDKTRFQFLHQGKPVADAEGSLLLPDGKKEKLSTDKDGFTPLFSGSGRYGLWLRQTLAKSGESEGKKYSSEKHYATLVGEFSPKQASLSPLPVGVSSLGAVASDGFLYVFGGHAGKTHNYSTRDVLGTFQRLDLNSGKSWEVLPSGPNVQGMNLVAHKGKIIRVGGMQPRNGPDQPADNHSLKDCASFDPKTNQWTALPPLPAGRSSHDLVIVGDQLVVVGGWELNGKGTSPVWHETTLIMDLSHPEPVWKSIPQPFQRRALTAASLGNKVYVLCGLDENGGSHKGVDILDLKTGKWTTGPEVPGNRVGFSPAAATLGDRLLVNTFDGHLLRLNAGETAWELVATTSTPRMVHRLIPNGKGVLLVGGASQGTNRTDIEFLAPSLSGKPPSLEANEK